MNPTKQKAPAFQFYVRDWLTDTALQSCKTTTRGIWINALALMWLAPERGKLTLTPRNFLRVLNCTVTERSDFITDAVTHRFCDLKEDPSGRISIVNRRMHRDWKVAESNKLRQRRFRAKHAPESAAPTEQTGACDPRNAQGNGDVASYSASASSSASSFASSSSFVDLKTVLRSTYSTGAGETKREDVKRSSQLPSDKEAKRQRTLCHTAERILSTLYGRGFPTNKEANEFIPYVLKLTGLISAGHISLDRVLGAARDAFDGHTSGEVKKRGPWFTALVQKMLREKPGGTEGQDRPAPPETKSHDSQENS